MYRSWMAPHLLLIVADCFQLADGRLVLVPDLPARSLLGPSSITLGAEIVSPSGRASTCEIRGSLTHFNIPTSTDVDERWRYVVQLVGLGKEDVPPGSHLYIFDEVFAKALRIGETDIRPAE